MILPLHCYSWPPLEVLMGTHTYYRHVFALSCLLPIQHDGDKMACNTATVATRGLWCLTLAPISRDKSHMSLGGAGRQRYSLFESAVVTKASPGKAYKSINASGGGDHSEVRLPLSVIYQVWFQASCLIFLVQFGHLWNWNKNSTCLLGWGINPLIHMTKWHDCRFWHRWNLQ